MYGSAGAIVRAVATLMTDERIRKGVSWILAAILSPVILLAAVFCSILGGSVDHNNRTLNLCFYGGTLPSDLTEKYRAHIGNMQTSFALLDEYIAEINSIAEEEFSLDSIRVKAVFYALYFGADSLNSRAHQQFADCFVT